MHWQNFSRKAAEFLFPEESDTWLAALRIGLGLQLVLYTLSWRADWNYVFAGNGNGLISRDLVETVLTFQSSYIPRLGWLVGMGSHFGLTEETILSLVWTCLVGAAGCLLLGLFCRASAIIAWFLHLSATASSNFLTYGMDNFTTIGLFYLMIAPLPDRYALDRWIWKPQTKDPHLFGFHRRVLQVHLCIIYFVGGATKCLGMGWWNGTSIWRALTCPPFDAISPDLLVSWKAVLPFLGIAVCLTETGYPFFIWQNKTRLVWLLCVLGMHVAIAFTMGLYLFSLIMIVLNVAAFGPGITRRDAKQVFLDRRQERSEYYLDSQESA